MTETTKPARVTADDYKALLNAVENGEEVRGALIQLLDLMYRQQTQHQYPVYTENRYGR